MKFRVDRDVLADAVAWAARSLPVRPSVPVLAGLLIEAEPTRALVALDASTTRPPPGPTLPAEVADEGTRPGLAAACSPTSAAACPPSRSRWSLDGPQVVADLRHRPGSACRPCRSRTTRRCPDMPAATGTVPSDVFAHAVAQAVTAAGRDDMLPVLTGVRIEIEGRADHPARHRPVPALAPRARLEAGARPTTRAVALVPGQGARRHRQVADRPAPRSRSRWPTAGSRRGHHRLRGRGRRRRTPYDHPAARRRVPQGPQPVPDRAPDHRHGSTRPRWSSPSSGSRWSPSATPPSSWRSARACSPSTPAPATRRRPRSRSRRRSTARTSPSASTRSSCSTA